MSRACCAAAAAARAIPALCSAAPCPLASLPPSQEALLPPDCFRYGDFTSSMGYCCVDRCPNMPQAWQLGWAPLQQLSGATLRPGTTVQVQLASQSNPSSRPTGPSGVRVVANWTAGVDPIFAGLRSRTGGDLALDPSYSNRINLYSSASTNTYDARPSMWRAGLAGELPAAVVLLAWLSCRQQAVDGCACSPCALAEGSAATPRLMWDPCPDACSQPVVGGPRRQPDHPPSGFCQRHCARQRVPQSGHAYAASTASPTTHWLASP